MRTFLLNEINKYDSYGINLLSAILKKEGHESRVFLVPDLIENTSVFTNIFLNQNHSVPTESPVFLWQEKHFDLFLIKKLLYQFKILSSLWNNSMSTSCLS